MFTFKDIGVVPSNPPAGYVGLYCNGGVLYWIDEAGVTTSISSGTGDLKADGTIPLTANWDVGAFTITALQFHSDIATGTAPFTVASTTVVANLNADKLDGADLIDEDNMASDSDVHVPTQQSVKAYVDGLVATALFDADFSAAGRMYTDGAGTYSVIKDLFSTVTPTVNTDSTSGYGVGSIIINTTGDGSVFICLDASVGAAVWMVVPDSADLGDYAYLQANIGATAAPTAGDDDLDGYSEGSMWLDTTNDKIYFCLDASTGAAVWQEVGAGGGSSPLTTKGDLYGYDTGDARIPVGSDGQVLTADSAQALGVKWAAPSGGTFVNVALLAGNTAAQNTALIDAAISSGDLLLQFPEGTFDIDPFDCVSNLHIRGMGIGATILKLGARTITDEAAFGGAINVHGTVGTHITNVVLQDFTVDGNKANITIAGTTDDNNVECIDFNYADYCLTERVRCINSVSEGLDYDNSTYCIDRDCQFEDCDGFGIHMSLASQYLRSENATAIDCGITHSRGGFDVYDSGGSTDCLYIGAYAKGCYRGFWLGGSRNSLIGCHAEASTNTGIRVDPGDQNMISGCRVYNTTGNGITLANGATRNSIVSTLVRDNSASGLYLIGGATNNVITGCTIIDDTTGVNFESGANNNALTTCSIVGAVTNSGSGNAIANNV